MNARDAINATMDMSSMVLNRYLADLTDADLLLRPGPGCNHLAYQLGHLISSECGLLESIYPGAAPELPAGFKEKHDKTQAGNDDPAQFFTKQEYLDLLAQVRAASAKALNATTDADLDKPGPEHFRKMFPTAGHVWILIATHGLMHAGQFVPVRRALGKPVVI